MEVSPTAVPPVCRIQDYGRFLYEKEKSERAARKKQKVITIKEVKFSVTVDEHDYQTKKNKAVSFLQDGDKVKASLRFRGRQMAHRELGYKIINRLILDIGEAGLGGVHAAHGRHDSARDSGSEQEGSAEAEGSARCAGLCSEAQATAAATGCSSAYNDSCAISSKTVPNMMKPLGKSGGFRVFRPCMLWPCILPCFALSFALGSSLAFGCLRVRWLLPFSC